MNVKMMSIAVLGITSLALIEAAYGDPLPAEFSGNWEFLPLPEGNPDYLKAACTEREGVRITPRDITWTTEGGCDIDIVRRSHWAGVTSEDNIAVSLICYEEEGRKRPLVVKTVEVWSLFKVNGEKLMTQTSIKDSHTSLLKKCE